MNEKPPIGVVTKDELALWDEVFAIYARAQFLPKLCGSRADDVIRERRSLRPVLQGPTEG